MVAVLLRPLVTLAAALAVLAAPAEAQAHAELVRAVPAASGLVDRPPATVRLTFSEPVEPRFASISVTDAAGRREQTAAPREGDDRTLVVPLKRLRQGWYLVYWRAISDDGHPVRGAYTFAVGPVPGPAPKFAIPSTSETAATPRLLVARWIVLLSAMAAIGLFVMRIGIARRAEPLGRAFAVSATVALIATPVYLVLATAQFALRSPLDLAAVVPLLRTTAFGRGYEALELCLALFVLAAALAIRFDRRRPVAVTAVALAAAAGVLLAPGLAGHAGETSPRGLAVALDAVHLGAGAVWLGGLIGLALTGDRAALARRFSVAAVASVGAIVTTGTVASILHLPTLASLWETGYGRALLVKIALLTAALALAAFHLLRPPLLRRVVAAEAALVAGAVFAAAVLTSLAPPAKAAAIGVPRVGPGAVDRAVTQGRYRVRVQVTPNQPALPNRVALTITRAGRPVTGATVTSSFTMLDMEMGRQSYRLPETAPGVYASTSPGLVMVGRWGLGFDVEPRAGAPLRVSVVDQAGE
jgi:copper transport protein